MRPALTMSSFLQMKWDVQGGEKEWEEEGGEEDEDEDVWEVSSSEDMLMLHFLHPVLW